MPTGAGKGLLSRYDSGGCFCDMTGRPDAPARHTAEIQARLAAMGIDELRRRQAIAERELYNLGITFTVYSESDAIDRILPFDVIPRVLSRDDWATIEAGIRQRVTALNLFLWDVYHDQRILADGTVPRELVVGNKSYRPEMADVDVPHGTYVHICGIDIVRDAAGRVLVLEDNGRCPSGVSYVVENRHMMLRTFPDLMDNIPIRPVENYGVKLLQAMVEISPAGIEDPLVVLLSPGVYNSAYFEHIFLAREMGALMVEGKDLVVEDDRVFTRTTAGLAPVHAIYRRINDDFLDPLAFDPTSLLGVPGLFAAYRKGNVALANAIGTGVADDKAVYAYMPRIIRYYLEEDPILPNVETHICGEKDGLAFTLDHLDELVVKPVGEAGGYGITVGPRADRAELESCRARLVADPAGFISQPMVNLSVSPTLIEDRIEPRHIDLRPFAITGAQSWVLPGGLTRVALREGSIIVNSSQGGGSKDTWVLE